MGRERLFRRADSFVPASLLDDVTAQLRARIVVIFSFVAVPIAGTFLVAYAVEGMWPIAAINLCTILGAPFGLLLLQRTASIPLSGNFMLGLIYLNIVVTNFFLGGLDFPTLMWLPFFPLSALFLAGMRQGLVWLLLVGAATVAFPALAHAGVLPTRTIGATPVIDILGILGLVSALYALGVLYEEVRTRAVAVLSDANRELIDARQRAEAANAAKTQFLAHMSHEIRTPLNGVIGMCELLAASPLREEERGYAEVARRSAEALVRVIDDILDLSKVEAGRLEFERVAFSLRDVVADVVALLGPAADAKGLALRHRIDSGLPHEVLGDPGRLRQVLVNLVGNAVKFTERGEVTIDVARGEADRVRIVIEDTGIGIPESRRTLVFEAFRQADSSTTRRYGGTGLGLSISHSLVAAMGGTLALLSTEGEGSTFTVELSLPRAPATRGPDASPAAGVAPEPDARAVLVLAADPVARRLLSLMLQRAGARCVAVADETAALRALAAGPFTAVLLDDDAPQKTKTFAALQDRARAAGHAPPRVVGLRQALAEGADDDDGAFDAVLHKPVRYEDLLVALDGRLADEPSTPRRPPPSPADLREGA